jgi:hypothetical protein
VKYRAVNYRNSPKHANWPEWLVLGWKYSPKSFYTRSWRAVVSHTVMGILFFSYLYFIIIYTIDCNWNIHGGYIVFTIRITLYGGHIVFIKTITLYGGQLYLLCFGTILSEHASESRSINPFN